MTKLNLLIKSVRQNIETGFDGQMKGGLSFKGRIER